MSTVDKAGRVADRSVIRALDWPPGTRLTIREEAGSLVALPADGGTCRVDRQGHMILPLAARRWCHLTAGDPLLLAADPACSRLVGYPVAVLDRVLGAVLLDGGEPA
ncbi:AbrB/MazE/SpoVT family DNA-binding domain-containing protein [Actinoplanes sp. TBRC 11911]|uniref:AbrB/MazE/SpoVT family DNA-binding domain-containing protein n=1 Tax=Actinoplanes sp. TBRC 11911 TaxID=2729386 RepID=UPI00145D57A6|nr:AbrB/MazE/SpoVT family DNA-binding domain-containing protein [Actinoplanes sp. TBRC 11911]NMO50143.1 AbrB/MazE/SpoVT family DNA-binding domain-containing protein [Actinoplanes sp. TBRC 11911]